MIHLKSSHNVSENGRPLSTHPQRGSSVMSSSVSPDERVVRNKTPAQNRQQANTISTERSMHAGGPDNPASQREGDRLVDRMHGLEGDHPGEPSATSTPVAGGGNQVAISNGGNQNQQHVQHFQRDETTVNYCVEKTQTVTRTNQSGDAFVNTSHARTEISETQKTVQGVSVCERHEQDETIPQKEILHVALPPERSKMQVVPFQQDNMQMVPARQNENVQVVPAQHNDGGFSVMSAILSHGQNSPNNIPYQLKVHLAVFLDPDHPQFINWCALADEMGLNNSWIKFFEKKPSPTMLVLNIWETKGKRTLADLKKTLVKINRWDAADLVQEYIDKQQVQEQEEAAGTNGQNPLPLPGASPQ